jgi:sugar phosphate isomerase/epimerase
MLPSIPEKFSNIAQPGVIISNCWPQSRSTPGATLAAIEQVLAGFPVFEAFQTVDIPTSAERQAIRRLLGDQGRPHTYTLTRVLAEGNASLSSLDPANRRLACDIVLAQMACAVEAGANTLAVISGPRPKESDRRAEALVALEESLATLCAAAAKSHPGLAILIEPLDYEAHKRNTLGKNAEAVAIAARLAARGLRLDLCIDTAHLILNREDVPAAVAEARAHIAEFHFVNAVLDPAHPLFGDRHLPFGPPGVVDLEVVAGIMVEFYRGGYFSPAARPRIYCEVWKPDDMESLAVVAHGQAALERGWARARQILRA